MRAFVTRRSTSALLPCAQPSPQYHKNYSSNFIHYARFAWDSEGCPFLVLTFHPPCPDPPPEIFLPPGDGQPRDTVGHPSAPVKPEACYGGGDRGSDVLAPFPGAFSHPLSKKPKSGVVEEFLQLDDCDCIVDKQPFKEALKDVVTELKTFTPSAGSGESASYRSLAEFLTGCVKTCHVALDKRIEFPLRQDRWYKDLEFIVGKAVVDSVDGAASLKPDITGGNGILAFAEERLYWKPPADKSTHRVTLPVEVKKQWKDMVSQAATYARCCSAQVQPGYSFLFWRSTKRATCADS